MSDLFEIKLAKVEVKIGKDVFPIVDPKFIDKIKMKKEWDALAKEKESLDDGDYLIRAYELNKKTILSFIPKMTPDFIDNELPSSALELLISKIGEISETKFGAVIEKTEKK